MDIDGLITKDRGRRMDERHVPFAKNMPNIKDVLEVIQKVRPGALIGASTVAKAFNEDIIRTMSQINTRPIIFALSNRKLLEKYSEQI